MPGCALVRLPLLGHKSGEIAVKFFGHVLKVRGRGVERWVREQLTEKKSISFGHCPKRGRALPEFVDPFFHHVVVPYILTSVSCYVIVDFYIQEALFARIIPSSLEGKF